MNGESHKKQIRDQVLEAIKSGRVAMRPRWRFVLKAVLGVLGGALLFLALLYLVSFIIFALRRTGVWFVPIFGARGWFVFLVSLPWILIIFSLIFIVVLEILVRRYSFAYRRPLLYSALGIIFLVLLGGVIVASTPFHGRVFRYAVGNRTPFAGDFYRGFGMPHFQDTYPGTITEVASTSFMMQDPQGEVLKIFISQKTRLPLGMDLEAGDAVVVFGPREGDTINAFGMREVDEDFEFSGMGMRHVPMPRNMFAP